MASLQDGRVKVDVSANKTLAALDYGLVQNIIADAKTVTLPAAAPGKVFTVRNGGAAKTSGPVGSGDNGSVAVVIAPNGTDTIAGGGQTGGNTPITNTKATANVGDEVTLVGITGGWVVSRMIGVWTIA